MRTIRIISVAAIGAALMYLLDPDRGFARRATVRERTMHAARIARRRTCHAITGAVNHTRGLVAECQARIINDRSSDEVLVKRVRSDMGHVVRHPHQVSVTADGGWIRLAGSVLPAEKEALVNTIREVPGVSGIEDRLDEHGWLYGQAVSTIREHSVASRE